MSIHGSRPRDAAAPQHRGRGLFRRRLQPLLADLTTHRLARDHGIDPAEHPDEARQLLGDEAWRILTPTEP